nr:NAD-dependent epimerase/dehydratase family protein [Arsukibacterium sp.]
MVSGASGFIGLALCQQLLQAGYAVKALGRNLAALQNLAQRYPQQLECVNQDLVAAAPTPELFNNVDFVVHLAAYASAAGISAAALKALNVDASVALAQQAQQAGVKRFIFLSSAQVVAIKGAIKGSESFNPQDSYALSKLAAEQALQALCQQGACSMQLVIIRPPLVYGPGVKGNFARLQQAVASGRWLPLGGLKHNKRSYLALLNLTDFIQLCITHPQAADQPWQLSDNADISTRELISNMARAQGKPARLLPVPLWLLGTIGKLTGHSGAVSRLTSAMQLDISATQQQLGWQPVITMKQQLALMCQSAAVE